MWLEIDKDLEKKVLSEIGVSTSRRLEGGVVNSVYYVELKNGSSGVLRISDNKKENWNSKKERAVLAHFFGHQFFPEVMSHGEFKDLSLSYNLLTFFEGNNMDSIHELPSLDVFKTLGKILGELHSDRTTEFGFVYDFENIGPDPRVHNSYPGPYQNGFEQHFIPAQGWVKHLISKGSRYSEKLKIIIAEMEQQAIFFSNNESTYNHGDYQFKNFLTFPDRLVGVVDFDSFRFGDPSSDIHMFLQNCIDRNLPFDSISSFFEGYIRIRSLPMGFDKKCLFYRCYRAIQEVIAIPFKLRNSPIQAVEPYKQKIRLFLQSLVDGSDPYINLFK